MYKMGEVLTAATPDRKKLPCSETNWFYVEKTVEGEKRKKIIIKKQQQQQTN